MSAKILAPRFHKPPATCLNVTEVTKAAEVTTLFTPHTQRAPRLPRLPRAVILEAVLTPKSTAPTILPFLPARKDAIVPNAQKQAFGPENLQPVFCYLC